MKITNLINQQEFDASEHTDVVSAAKQANCAINYSCRQGICGECAGVIVNGTFSISPDGSEQSVTKSSLPVSALMCQVFPKSDLTVECQPQHAPVITRAVRIGELSFPSSKVAVVVLTTLDGKPFDYQAGQFIALRWAGDRRKYFSLASPHSSDGSIQLHIGKLNEGEFTRWLFEHAEVGHVLGLEGPFGNFQWTTPSDRPAILMATGTGFSPIKSLIESHQLWNRTAPTYFYWGGRILEDLYLQDLPFHWDDIGNSFHYIPVLSTPIDGWRGRVSRIPSVIMADHTSLADWDIYACGSPGMIEEAKQLLVHSRGLDETRFFADAFSVKATARDTTTKATSFNIRFSDSTEGRITGDDGLTILQVLLRAGVQLDHYCGGGAVCGTCKVNAAGEACQHAYIGEDERDLLECLPNIADGDRLACQTRLSPEFESATIHLPGTPSHVSNLVIQNHE